MKRWYEITAKSDKAAQILIYEQIGRDYWTGEGIAAKQFITDLNALEVDRIEIRINSPGGNVFDGNAIYNALKAHKAEKHVKIDGLAGSIASIIAMSGDTIEMPENAMMMIHKASGLVMGNADDMLSMATVLEKIDEGFVGTYHARGKLDRKKIADMLTAETWITAQEAVEYGLADTITEKVEIQACFNGDLMARFKNVPEQFKTAGKSGQNLPKEEIIMDLNELKTKHPNLFAEVLALGKAEGMTAGIEKAQAGAVAEGKAQGAEAERARIKGVYDQGRQVPGHEALMTTLMWDGKTTGPEAAVQILAAEGKLRETTAAALKADGVAPVVAAAPPAVDAPLVEDENIPIDERAKAAWDKDVKIRNEFRTWGAYLAFRKAEAAGKVKILKK